MTRETELPLAIVQGARPPTRRLALLGLALLVALVGAVVAWGTLAPLESAAVAPGTVGVDTNRKTIQHLEGGIVREIRVREGQTVRKGQVLVVLDDTRDQAKIRLAEAQIAATRDQLELLRQEIEDTQHLFRKGLARKPRLLALLRKRVELKGQMLQHGAELHAARDVVRRSKVRAPQDGRVVGLKAHTAGGVIRAGDPILSLVPSEERLVVEARVDPNDIDVVKPGLAARVRLTPYNARSTHAVDGKVVWVSADRMTDDRTGGSYYLARVEVADETAGNPDRLALYPGMPAEVMIVTGRHSFLGYLVAPVLRSMNRAFREQ